MSILDSIKAAEEKAVEIRLQGSETAREIQREAQAEAQLKTEEIIKTARQKSDDVLDDARRKASKDKQKILDQRESEMRAMVETAKSNISEAVQFIVERIESQ